MTKSLRPFLTSIVWWIGMVVAAGGALLALAQDLETQPAFCWILYVLPSLTAFAFGRLWQRGDDWSRPFRIVHWLVLLLMVYLASQLVPVQWSQLSAGSPLGCTPLLVATIIFGCMSWILWMRRNRREQIGISIQRWKGDLIWTMACAILLSAALLGALELGVSYREREAEQRWAGFGRPMHKVNRYIAPVDENDSLQQIGRHLSAFGVKSLYKNRGPQPDLLALPQGLFQMLPEDRLGDEILEASDVSQYLAVNQDALTSLYRDVLVEEPPSWEVDPTMGFGIRVPNYLIIRKLSQVIRGDVLEKTRLGRHAEAQEALNAGLRLSQSLGQHPTMVGQMVRCAVESLLVTAYARLQTEDAPIFDELAGRDMEKTREDFRKCLQAQAWIYMHAIDELDEKQAVEWANGQLRARLPRFMTTGNVSFPLPKRLIEPLVRLEAAHAAIGFAEMVRLSLLPEKLAGPVFGMASLDQIIAEYPSMQMPNCLRAWSRINASLLLREQAEIIRGIRAKIRTGSVERTGELASKVIPGRKWQFQVNAKEQSMVLSFSAVPEGLFAVASHEYFLTPIDGSKSWRFARQTVQEESSKGTIRPPIPEAPRFASGQ